MATPDYSKYSDADLEAEIAKLSGGGNGSGGKSGGTSGGGEVTGSELDKHLGGVLSGQGNTIVETARKYGVDPHLATAIMQFESANGTSHMARTKNNVAGIFDSRANTYRTFESVSDAIDFTIRNLKKNYLDQGLDTPEKIGPKYAPVGASNDPNATNKEWPAAVRANLARLGGPAAASSVPADLTTRGNVIEEIDTSKVRMPTIYQTRRPEDKLSQTDLALAARAKTQDIAKTVIDAGGSLTKDQYDTLVINNYAALSKMNEAPQKQALPSTVLENIGSLSSSFNMLDHLAELHGQAVDKKGSGFGSWASAAIPLDQQLTQEGIAFNTSRAAMIPLIARGVMQQSGVLTEPDVKKAEALMPNPGDSKETVQTKIRELKYLIQNNVQGKIDTFQGPYDTSDLDAVNTLLKANLKLHEDKVSGAPGDTAQQTNLYDQNQKQLGSLQGQSSTASKSIPVTAPAPAPAVGQEPSVLTPQESQELGRRKVQTDVEYGGFSTPWTTSGTTSPKLPKPLFDSVIQESVGTQ